MEDTLKIFYAYYVSENDDLTYSEKLSMLDLLENDTEAFLDANPILREFFTNESGIEEIDIYDMALMDVFKSESLAIGLQELDPYEMAKKSLSKKIDKIQQKMNKEIDAKQLEIEKKLRDAKMPKPKSDITPIPAKKGDFSDFPSELVPAHKPSGGAAPEPGAIAKAAQTAGEYISQNPGKTAAIAATAAAVITAGVVAYRRFLSKAARNCRGASNKSECMKGERQKALRIKIRTMEAGKEKCSRTSKPYTCKSKIDAKIQKLQGKLAN